jgi:hypothetical protein
MRKSSKFILVAGALAALAVPSVASANVAVENGVGHVDKSDVQTALKWNNGDFDTNVGSLKFTADAELVTDFTWSCRGSTEVVHQYFTYPAQGAVKATEVKSSNGKQITGWNLTGMDRITSVGQGTITDSGPCPAGSFRYEIVGNSSSKTITGGLKVNGQSLPNTPVAAPTV